MGMAQGPGEELAPRGRTGYSDAALVRAEGRLFTALSAKQRHGRPPGVSVLPRDPHPCRGAGPGDPVHQLPHPEGWRAAQGGPLGARGPHPGPGEAVL